MFSAAPTFAFPVQAEKVECDREIALRAETPSDAVEYRRRSAAKRRGRWEECRRATGEGTAAGVRVLRSRMPPERYRRGRGRTPRFLTAGQPRYALNDSGSRGQTAPRA